MRHFAPAFTSAGEKKQKCHSIDRIVDEHNIMAIRHL